MNGFNPTISNVFSYPDMASQIERLNDKQAAGLRNAINTAVDVYKFKKLKDELTAREAAKKAVAERIEAEAAKKAEDRKAIDEYVKNMNANEPRWSEADQLEYLDEDALDYDLMYGVMKSPEKYTPEQIKDVQYMSGVTEDGVFGPNTKKAIATKLQKRIDTPVDGIWSKASEAAWTKWRNSPDYSRYYL